MTVKKQSKLDLDCIVLGAGLSSRMGETNKLLLELDKKPLIWHSAGIAGGCCERVIVVEGHLPLTGLLPEALNIELVHNAAYRLGQLGSLQRGLEFCRTESVFIFLADLPLVSAGTFYALAGAMGDADAVFPVFDGRRGHPVLLGREAIALIRMADPGEKAMEVIKTLDVRSLNVDDPGVCMDIDTPEDYQRAITLFAEKPK